MARMRFRMTSVLSVMFLLYAGLQLYAVAKASAALALTGPAIIVLLAWVALMTVMPLLLWRWEQRGWHRPVLLGAWIGYSWMGVAFLFFWVVLALDLLGVLLKLSGVHSGLSAYHEILLACSLTAALCLYGFVAARRLRIEGTAAARAGSAGNNAYRAASGAEQLESLAIHALLAGILATNAHSIYFAGQRGMTGMSFCRLGLPSGGPIRCGYTESQIVNGAHPMNPTITLVPSAKHLNVLRALGISFAIAGLFACGSNNSSSNNTSASTPTATISRTNAQSVTALAFDATSIGSSGGDVSFNSSFFVPTGNVATSSNIQTPNLPQGILAFDQQAANITQNLSQQGVAPGVSANAVTTENCLVSGTRTRDHVDTSSTITYNNCSDVAGNTINGTISSTNEAFTADSISYTVDFNLIEARDGYAPISLMGGFNVYMSGPFSGAGHAQMTTATATVTGSSFTISNGTRTDTLSNFSFATATDANTNIQTVTANFTITSSVIGGSVTYTTTTPFQRNAPNQYPHSGAAHITGAGTTSLDFTVLGNETLAGNQIRIDVDTNGAPPYEATLFTTWSALMSR
jgi:hypothetical protein